MALSSTPSLHTDDHVAFFQNTEVYSGLDAPFQTAIDILLPVGLVEIGLFLGEQEGINAAIQVGILFLELASAMGWLLDYLLGKQRRYV